MSGYKHIDYYINSICDPKEGSGTICFYIKESTYSFRGTFFLVLEIKYKSRPWQANSNTPLVYDFIHPFSQKNGIPVLRIFASRYVTIDKVNNKLSELEKLTFSLKNPLVKIFRIQAEEIPISFLENYIKSKILIQPVQFWPPIYPQSAIKEFLNSFKSSYDFIKNFGKIHQFQITMTTLDTMIKNVNGNLLLKINVPQNTPAAFAYDFYFESPIQLFLIIVHSKGVEISFKAEKEYLNIFVILIKEESINKIPRQGTNLSNYYKDGLNLLQTINIDEKSEIYLSAKDKIETSIFEIGVGFIPIVGDMFDWYQLYYAISKKKSIWGETLTTKDYIILTLSVMMPFVSAGVFKTIKEIAEKSKYSFLSFMKSPLDYFDPITREAIELIPDNKIPKHIVKNLDSTNLIHIPQVFQPFYEKTILPHRNLLEISGSIKKHNKREEWAKYIDKDFFDVLFGIKSDDKKNLITSLYKFVSKEKTYEQVFNEGNEILGELFKKVLAKKRLEDVFTNDYSEFKLIEVQQSYNKYISNGGKALPIEWILGHASDYQKSIIKNYLGDEPKKLIESVFPKKFFLAENQIIPVTFYKKHKNKIDSYSALKIKVSTLELDEIFEVVPLIERRFVISPKFIDSEYYKTSSIVLPKINFKEQDLIAYNHFETRRILSQLIPVNLEKKFSIQQIWDAHVFAYKKTVRDSLTLDNILKTLKDEFEKLVVDSLELIQKEEEINLEDYVPEGI